MKPFICMCLLLAAALPAHGREASRQFRVGAVVPPRATVETVESPVQLELTQADVARGYKKVMATYRVRANDARGYLLRLTPRAGLTERIEVAGLEVDGVAASVVLRQHTVEMHRTRSGPSEVLTLEFRFVLAGDTAAGTYSVPVEVGVSPIGADDDASTSF